MRLPKIVDDPDVNLVPIGKRRHCNVDPHYVYRDGPISTFAQLQEIPKTVAWATGQLERGDGAFLTALSRGARPLPNESLHLLSGVSMMLRFFQQNTKAR